MRDSDSSPACPFRNACETSLHSNSQMLQLFFFNILDPTLWPKNETHGPCGNVAMANFLHAMIFETSQDPQQRSPYVHYFFGTKISTADKLSRYRGGHADLCLGWWLWNKPFFRMSGLFLVVVLNISIFTYTWCNDGLNPPTSFVDLTHPPWVKSFQIFDELKYDIIRWTRGLIGNGRKCQKNLGIV